MTDAQVTAEEVPAFTLFGQGLEVWPVRCMQNGGPSNETVLDVASCGAGGVCHRSIDSTPGDGTNRGGVHFSEFSVSAGNVQVLHISLYTTIRRGYRHETHVVGGAIDLDCERYLHSSIGLSERYHDPSGSADILKGWSPFSQNCTRPFRSKRWRAKKSR